MLSYMFLTSFKEASSFGLLGLSASSQAPMRHGGIPHFNTRQEISESDGTLRYVRLRHAEARMKPADKPLSSRGITKAVYHVRGL